MPAGRVNAERLHLKRLDPQRGKQGLAVRAQGHRVDLIARRYLLDQAQCTVAFIEAILRNQAIAGAGDVGKGGGVGVCDEAAGNGGGQNERFIHERTFIVLIVVSHRMTMRESRQWVFGRRTDFFILAPRTNLVLGRRFWRQADPLAHTAYLPQSADQLSERNVQSNEDPL